MKVRGSIRLILLVLITIFSASNARAAERATVNQQTVKYGFTLGSLGGTELVSAVERAGEKLKFISIRGKSDSMVLELEITTPVAEADAKAGAEKRLQIIARQYGAQRTPYPGELTNIAICNETQKATVREVKGKDFVVNSLVGLASERNAFGVCDKTVAKNLGLLGFFYLKKTSAQVQIRAFQSQEKTSKEKLFASLNDLALVP